MRNVSNYQYLSGIADLAPQYLANLQLYGSYEDSCVWVQLGAACSS